MPRYCILRSCGPSESLVARGLGNADRSIQPIGQCSITKHIQQCKIRSIRVVYYLCIQVQIVLKLHLRRNDRQHIPRKKNDISSSVNEARRDATIQIQVLCLQVHAPYSCTLGIDCESHCMQPGRKRCFICNQIKAKLNYTLQYVQITQQTDGMCASKDIYIICYIFTLIIYTIHAQHRAHTHAQQNMSMLFYIYTSCFHEKLSWNCPTQILLTIDIPILSSKKQLAIHTK